jgi:hypothetical protein
MSYDGRPVRAAFGARAAAADRRTGILAIAGLGLALTIAACGGSASSGGVAGATGTPLASTEASASAESSAAASPSGSGLNQGFLIFQEQNASKVSGGGTITDLGDGSVAVTLGVVAVGFTDPMPARLVSGSCADAASAPPPSFAPEPSAAASSGTSAGASAAPCVAAPSMGPRAGASAEASGATGSVAPSPATLPVDLVPAEAGGSNTIVQIALADLLSSPSSVLVYKSAAEPTLVACGDISNTLQIPSSAPASAPAASAEASMEASFPAASGSTTP